MAQAGTPPAVSQARGNLTVVAPDQDLKVLDPPLRIHTTDSTDEGVAFWVEVDGLTVLHTGDLALWGWEDSRYEQAKEAYLREIDKLVALRQPLDIAFLCADLRLPGRGKLSGAPLAAERLRPAFVMAIHNDQPGRGAGAAEAASQLRNALSSLSGTSVAEVRGPGDTFSYRR